MTISQFIGFILYAYIGMGLLMLVLLLAGILFGLGVWISLGIVWIITFFATAPNKLYLLLKNAYAKVVLKAG